MPNQNAINKIPPFTVPDGGLGSTSYTAYSLLAAGTTNTGNAQNVSGLGTAGQILRSNGASALPSWATGGLNLIQTQTANNSATVDFTTGINTTYNTYVVYVAQILPVTNSVLFYCQYSSDGGATWLNTSYQSGVNTMPYNVATFTNANSTTNIVLSNAIPNTGGATSGLNGYYYFDGLGSNVFQVTSGFFTNANATSGFQTNYRTVQFTANALRFYMSSGNISSGTISLYGISK